MQLWPIYDTLGYAFIPTAVRPLFNSFMSIAWGGYLSAISQPEPKAEQHSTSKSSDSLFAADETADKEEL